LTEIYNDIITPREVVIDETDVVLNERLLTQRLYLKNLICAIFMIIMMAYLFWFLVS
tara:strand:+ start:175 stop:345 length:171 start_codon:yes stop_codon:yes gene_type:complete